MFLDQHPGWSYRDLQEAPAELIDAMRDITQARAEMARRDSGALR